MIDDKDVEKIVDAFKGVFATKEDLGKFSTKEDLGKFATKEDLGKFATKEDLGKFATKEDLEVFPTAQMVQKGFAEVNGKIAALENNIKTVDQKLDSFIEKNGDEIGILKSRVKTLEEAMGVE